MNPAAAAVVSTNLEDHGFKLLARGKVRDVYEIDNETLLFVATDRISAYDVIMKNVSSTLSQTFSFHARFFYSLQLFLFSFPAFMPMGDSTNYITVSIPVLFLLFQSPSSNVHHLHNLQRSPSPILLFAIVKLSEKPIFISHLYPE